MLKAAITAFPTEGGPGAAAAAEGAGWRWDARALVLPQERQHPPDWTPPTAPVSSTGAEECQD